jgi:hypothetical protein
MLIILSTRLFPGMLTQEIEKLIWLYNVLLWTPAVPAKSLEGNNMLYEQPDLNL